MDNVLKILEKSKTGLLSKFGLKNMEALPKISKVVVSTAIGSIKDPKKREIIPDRLAKITGQKAVPTLAKKSIATFKLREGEVSGYVVTLRKERMFSFLDRLINVALPRQRDFRGISSNAVDGMGNLTIGIKEHTIFPETADEELKNVFGFSITIVTTTNDKEKAKELFRQIGVPFKK